VGQIFVQMFKKYTVFRHAHFKTTLHSRMKIPSKCVVLLQIALPYVYNRHNTSVCCTGISAVGYQTGIGVLASP